MLKFVKLNRKMERSI